MTSLLSIFQGTVFPAIREQSIIAIIITSTLRVKFILMGRQLMYYHTVLRKSEELSTNENKWLFKMRVRMCPNKTNFEGMYKPDLSCSLCLDKTQKETELHLLNCAYFQQYPELYKKIRKA